MLDRIEQIVAARKATPPAGSYVAALLAKGEAAVCRKIGEEAVEVVTAALGGEGDRRVVEEVADLWFHTLVLLGAARRSRCATSSRSWRAGTRRGRRPAAERPCAAAGVPCGAGRGPGGRRACAGADHRRTASITRATGYRVTLPGPAGSSSRDSRADLELRHRTASAGMLVNAVCDAGGGAARPDVLARQLLIGLRDRAVVESDEVPVNGRRGVRTGDGRTDAADGRARCGSRATC